MFCRRASSALRDGRRRLSYWLVGVDNRQHPARARQLAGDDTAAVVESGAWTKLYSSLGAAKAIFPNVGIMQHRRPGNGAAVHNGNPVARDRGDPAL